MNPVFSSAAVPVPSSVELNRRKKTQGAPKRLSDEERRDVERNLQSGNDKDVRNHKLLVGLLSIFCQFLVRKKVDKICKTINLKLENG